MKRASDINFLVINGFRDPKNIVLDTKIMALSYLVPEIWTAMYFGGHFVHHLE